MVEYVDMKSKDDQWKREAGGMKLTAPAALETTVAA